MATMTATARAARRFDVELFALLFGSSVAFSLTLARLPGGIAAFWISSGLWVGWMLSRPTTQWGRYIVAGVLIDVFVRQTTTMAGWQGIGLTAANVLEVLIVAGTIRYRYPDIQAPRRYLGLGWTATAATLVACAISAMVATAAVGGAWGKAALSILLTWYCAHVVGMVIAATATLVVLTQGLGLSIPRSKRPGFAGSLMLLVIALGLIFRQSGMPLLFLAYPPLLWLAHRYRFAGVIAGTLALVAVGMFATATGHGPLMLFGGSALERLVLLQAYICVACLMTFPIAMEVADQMRLVSRVRTSEARYRMLADYSHDIIVRLSSTGERLYVSPSVTSVLGWSAEELIGTSHNLVHPEDVIEQQMGLTAGQLSRDPVTSTYRVRHKNGHYVWVEAITRSIPNEAMPDVDDVLLTGRDVSIRVAAQEALQETRNQLEALARVDALTGLPNRRQFDERLSQLVLRNRRRGDPLALLYVDVDYFKAVNDRLGHPAGDEVLRTFARRLSGCVRASDMVARVGGDEFAVLVDDAQLREAAAIIAQKIIAAMRHPITIMGQAVIATASIGVAYCSERTSEKLLCASADAALYVAKAAGRDTFHITQIEGQPIDPLPR